MRPQILIVDDDPIIREVYAALLGALEADVVQASDGYEALAVVRRNSFSLVLLDINMPGLSGRQVAAALRRDPHSNPLPIVFVTGEAPEDGASAEETLGKADMLLVKPVEPETLKSLARLLLRLYAERRQAIEEVQYARTELRELRARVATLAPVDRG